MPTWIRDRKKAKCLWEMNLDAGTGGATRTDEVFSGYHSQVRMLIISHRANLRGPEPAFENSLARTRECIGRGWSVETDIRRAPNGRFYISHDPAEWSPANDAVPFCAAWRDAPGPIALNIKEVGDEEALIGFLREQQILDRVFLFDMELLEARPGDTARRFRALDPSVLLGARVSDRQEPLSRALSIEVASVIWVDEFDALWATAADVRTLKNAGKRVYGVAPDLHRKPLDVMRRRWEDFITWGVDGICTDDAEGLEQRLIHGTNTERAA